VGFDGLERLSGAEAGGQRPGGRGPARVRLLVLDADGVLTDGSIYYGPEGETALRFSAHDGYGIRCLLEAGVAVAILSGRKSAAVVQRAQALGVKRVVQGAREKGAAVADLARQYGLAPAEVGFVGDDVFDLPAVRVAGWSAAPSTARPEVRRAADYVSPSPGGAGAVRDVAEVILRARGAWPPREPPVDDGHDQDAMAPGRQE
jgi:3-deoxy-D-manno-octulosonate 8-phosphate phosphatase (KDO 8-P phosphatase)